MPDIPHGTGPQQCIHYRMGQHICIGVTKEALLPWDIYATQNQFSVFRKAMNIISMTDPHSSPRLPKIASAVARSSGVVNLIFS